MSPSQDGGHGGNGLRHGRRPGLPSVVPTALSMTALFGECGYDRDNDNNHNPGSGCNDYDNNGAA